MAGLTDPGVLARLRLREQLLQRATEFQTSEQKKASSQSAFGTPNESVGQQRWSSGWSPAPTAQPAATLPGSKRAAVRARRQSVNVAKAATLNFTGLKQGTPLKEQALDKAETGEQRQLGDGAVWNESECGRPSFELSDVRRSAKADGESRSC